MDVTSLLNSSSMVDEEPDLAKDTVTSAENTPADSTPSAIEKVSPVPHPPSPDRASLRRTDDPKIPNRNRTPWDANGYVLPLTLDTKSTQVPALSMSHSESPAESVSPKSPGHKFSNSYSSLSSYDSSSSSLSHSRISSMSTVGGIQPMSTIPYIPPVKIDPKDTDLTSPEVHPATHHQSTNKDGIASPIKRTEEPPLADLIRSSSPSDAMLMSSNTPNSDRMSIQRGTITGYINRSPSYAIPSHLTRVHKRALSAPNLAGVNPTDRSFPALPPSPYQGAHEEAYTMEETIASAVDNEQPSNMEEIRCMYKENCDTGSQPRKAISHVFGRNKSCTRNIPQHVWVHFCRKHYQRSRYRNAQEYARVQGELVQKQIRRVQAWSDGNKSSGQGGILIDWTLTMRKREQIRLQAKFNKKRPFPTDSGDEEQLDRAVLSGTAVPDWLRDECDDGYSTPEIQAIVSRLQVEMDTKHYTQIPDIEILPNISMDASDDTRNKATLKRKTTNTNGAHKRSRSVGVTLQNGSQPTARHHPYWRQENGFRSSPTEKRQRTSDGNPNREYGHVGGYRYPQQPAPTTTSTLRPMVPLPHRPFINQIRENREAESYYNGENEQGSHYGFGARLPSPSPQRHGRPPRAEFRSDPSHGYFDDRRHPHQRSYSELGGFHNGFGFRQPSDYPPMAPTFSGEAMPSSNRGTMSAEHSQTSQAPPGYYDDEFSTSATHNYTANQPIRTARSPLRSSPYSGYRHTRHQSTPIVPHNFGHHTSYVNTHTREPLEPHLRPNFEHVPPYPHHQHSYTPSRQPANRPQVQETDQAKAVFSDRR